MIYLAIAAAVVLIAALFIGVRYRDAYHRRKELERRGRIKKPETKTGDEDSTES
jgi:hypothetical protein